MEDTNWDFGASLGDGKVFILEDKATWPVRRKQKLPLDTHRIDVDRRQLNWYCDNVEPSIGVPVFYVLPAPPWQGRPTGSSVVPDQAICRVSSLDGAFESWAHVIGCTDLRRQLGGRNNIDTDALPCPNSRTLAAFLHDVGACQLGKRVSGAGTGAQLVTKEEAVQAAALSDATIRTLSRRRLGESTMTGSALAVFVPAGDIANWGNEIEQV